MDTYVRNYGTINYYVRTSFLVPGRETMLRISVNPATRQIVSMGEASLRQAANRAACGRYIPLPGAP